MTISASTTEQMHEPGNRPQWRAVAIPSEHGGWGLTSEPVLLGLLVAFSWPGLAIGVAAIVAFLVRTPLKLALVDRRRHRSLDRTRMARRFAITELVVLFALASAALVSAGWTWLVPVAVAVPFVGVELWFDIRSRGRRLIPEVAGSVGISAVAAAIVIADGGSARLAAAVWLILAARSIASIPFIRTQITRLRHGESSLRATDAFQAAGVSVAVVASVVDTSVFVGTIAVALLAAAHTVWTRRLPVPPAKVLGLRQMALGFAIVTATAIGVVLV